ncbi:HNH endonuclease [Robinsoniella peoriensis]|uniref:HNH endonuclease n=1 Tax=Robinsoniella peoriensis TaxID=180332 RepID=UPI0037521694
MPRKPKKPCRNPGCPNLTESAYCEEHSKQYQPERAGSTERGYNSKWRKARTRYLKEHPLCVRCREYGKLVKAVVVDHVTPHRGNEVLFWDESNWQALCKQCHDKKTMTDDRYQEYRY